MPWCNETQVKLTATKPDLVVVVTRYETHRMLAELAIAHGIAVIVQKPFATTPPDCVAIVEAARRAGFWLAVHENFRFQAPLRGHRLWRDRAAGMGAHHLSHDVYDKQPCCLTEKRLVIADVGIHLLDLAGSLTGEVVRISCETQTRRSGIPGEDTATMLLRHESRALSVVECTYQSHRDPDPFPETLLETEGADGTLLVHPDRTMRVSGQGGSRMVDIDSPFKPWTALPWNFSQTGCFAACAHFLDSFRRGVAAETSGVDNLRSFALVDAVYRAAETHNSEVPFAWVPE